jgi:hypothetical protein
MRAGDRQKSPNSRGRTVARPSDGTVITRRCRIEPGLKGWLHHLRGDRWVDGGGGGCGPGGCRQQSRTRSGHGGGQGESLRLIARRQAGQPEVAAAAAGVEGRDHLAGHQAGLVGQLVDDPKPAADPSGRVDHHRQHRHTPAQRQRPVTVRLMVTVVAQMLRSAVAPAAPACNSRRANCTYSGCPSCWASSPA